MYKSMLIMASYTSKMNATGWLAPIGMGLGVAVGFLFGTQTMAIVFVGTLALDFITGIASSFKRGIPITSDAMKCMFFKWVAYFVVILAGAMIDVVLGSTWIHTASLGWVILSELVSILENCEVILGKSIPFLSKIKRAIAALRNNNEHSIPTNHTMERLPAETTSSDNTDV